VSHGEFGRVYRSVVDEVWRRWSPAMQEELARHCRGWAPGRYDFRGYLDASVERYHRAYLELERHGGRRVCDVGGFWGVFATTLARLGFSVAMTEALRFYGPSFRGLFDLAAAEGVRVLDHDPFQPDRPLEGPFDFVAVMAVLEHYPHSLRDFATNVAAGLAPGGALFLEVPNVAHWPKRINLLRGVSPLPSVREIWESDTPFTGHHHEFSRAELRDLAGLAGLEVRAEHAFNYSPRRGGWKYRALVGPVEALAFRLLPDSRECLAVTCVRPEGAG
jgi:2-polyprenyl-3-methyl-5-hydroxy-6-metoxy-1,4-benzoquinol methylase